MDHLGIPDRRRLRRKLTFWRVAAILAVVALVVAIGRFSGLAEGASTGRHIARVEISGVITADDELLETLKDVAENDDVEALVVTIESPGGTTYGGERLYEAIRAVAERKPVVAEVRGLAASAGYMVAVAADHIVAGRASLVGSIGVLFQYGNVTELLDKIGVSVDSVKSSPLKAQPSPFEPADPRAEAMMRGLVEDTYQWFVGIVAERRAFSRDRTLELADGRIFTGRQALDNGLVDALGGEKEVLVYLGERGVDTDLRVIEWRPDRDGGFFFSRALAALATSLPGDLSEIAEPLAELTNRKLFLDGLLSVWQFGGNNRASGGDNGD